MIGPGMLLAFWLASLAPSYCDPPQSAALTVVCPYLEALRSLDHDAMVRSLSPEVRSVNVAGEERAFDSEFMRQMRGFERSVHTQWTYQVDSVERDSVLVTLTETNDFYDLLGLGPRHQTERYTVQDGRIVRMATLSLRHENGDYALTFAGFRDWLMHTDAARDPALVRGGRLLFTEESGRRLLPWLERWHEGHEMAVSPPPPKQPALRSERAKGTGISSVRISATSSTGTTMLRLSPRTGVASSSGGTGSPSCAGAGHSHCSPSLPGSTSASGFAPWPGSSTAGPNPIRVSGC
jgi:hypothetical protein